MSSHSSPLDAAFNAEAFRETGHRLMDQLADYLRASLARSDTPVLPAIGPEAMLREWPGDFSEHPGTDFQTIIGRVLRLSHNLQHPRYIGHQCCTALPLAALNDLVGTFLNNASAVYEMGPVNIAMEKRLVQWMATLAGYGPEADGIFTNGGTLGNLTALLSARQVKADYNIWTEGVDSGRPLAVLVSEQCHYSVKRAVSVMGLGERAVYPVAVDREFHMDREDLARQYKKATGEDRRVFAVVANGCSTATGSFDDLEAVADFTREHDLWLHVDAAHGGSALLSGKYRSLLKGLNRADSLIWDAHKMMMIPALATAVLFREGRHSYESFSQKASYLFEKESREEWYNYAHRTMECTKTMMGIKLYVPLAVYGTGIFREFIDRTYDLTRAFADLIEASPDFELAVRPQSNIICFRYLPDGIADPDDLQRRIRRRVLERERFYIVQTDLKKRFYLRCTVINPGTTIGDIEELLQHIRETAAEI